MPLRQKQIPISLRDIVQVYARVIIIIIIIMIIIILHTLHRYDDDYGGEDTWRSAEGKGKLNRRETLYANIEQGREETAN